MKIQVTSTFSAIQSSDKSISIECVSMQEAVDRVQCYTDIVIKGKRYRIGG